MFFLITFLWLSIASITTESEIQNQTRDVFTLTCSPLKLMDKLTYLGSSVSSTKNSINTWLAKTWTAIDRLSVIWKSDLSDKIKRRFFQAAFVSMLLYGCTTWTLIKCLKKILESNCKRMLRAILNKSWSNTLQNSSCAVTYLPSLKPFKSDQLNMQDTTGEVRASS